MNFPKRNISQKDVYKYVHSNLILNRLKLKTTQMPLDTKMEKWIVVCPHNRTLFGNKKEWSIDTQNMDGFQKYTEWKQPDRKMHLLAPIQQERVRSLLLLSLEQTENFPRSITFLASLCPELGHSPIHEPVHWSGGLSYPYSRAQPWTKNHLPKHTTATHRRGISFGESTLLSTKEAGKEKTGD